MKLVKFKNVTIGYDKHAVLSDLSFSIEKGDFICIVGPNGSGKSTLIKSLLGLINPLKGKISYPNISKNFIGYMPQDNKVDPNFPASVYEIVLSGCLNKTGIRPFYSKEEKIIANENIKLLGIENLKRKRFCDLSGGQRQKVLLARCLCATKELLILDEPSNNLDYESKLELYEIIKKLNKEKDVTVIIITHDMDYEDLIGNKVLSLKEENITLKDIKEYVKNV